MKDYIVAWPLFFAPEAYGTVRKRALRLVPRKVGIDGFMIRSRST